MSDPAFLRPTLSAAFWIAYMRARPIHPECKPMPYPPAAEPSSSSSSPRQAFIHLSITTSLLSCHRDWRLLSRPIRFLLPRISFKERRTITMKRKCTELLRKEHKTILRIVDVLTAIAEESERVSQLNITDVVGILEILRVIGDEYHQGKEEAALFPVFTKVCDRTEVEAVRHMLHEHDEDRFLIAAMEHAVHQSNVADFALHARKLADLQQTHAYKEDTILFEIVNRSLSYADDQKVLAEFDAFDKAFKSQRHDRLLHRLQMLEWKYVRAAA